MNSPEHSWRRWLLVSAAVIALDQASKFWIASAFRFGELHEILPVFNLVLAHNSGAAFSLLADATGWQRLFFSVIAVAASAIILHLLRRHSHQPLFSLALVLILGGALGNLIDRIWLGYVIDFLDFHWDEHHFAAFNVADTAITCGAAMLVWDSFRKQ